MDEILVTGLGPVSAIGIGRAAWRQALAVGRNGNGPLTLFAGAHSAAQVRDFHLENILSSSKTYLDRASEFALAAGQLALTDAGLTPDMLERWRAGVVVGSEFGCLGTLQTYTTALQQKGARLANPLLFSHLYVNTPASLLAIEFGLGGHHGTFTGEGAGQQALAAATEALLLGRADIILAVGVEAISQPLYAALDAEGALADNELGEGACALLLETREHAARRGASGMTLPEVADGATLRPFLGLTFAAEPFFAVARALV